ncbi:hypothetical protein MPL3365_290044 [Mesorhizobium plurifarium]|uniref:Uncharacterized protein n=1 Tax=Mesorhizobium plurifarium TaxID=69974 RepID=A0A090G6L0_MESPL|nr:hypothetical protein MPL3365_290044 [Mesorhizobium plurifarium]
MHIPEIHDGGVESVLFRLIWPLIARIGCISLWPVRTSRLPSRGGYYFGATHGKRSWPSRQETGSGSQAPLSTSFSL